MAKNKRLIALAIALSVVALVLSTYSAIVTKKTQDADFFYDKVEVAIDAYVKKQQEKQQAPPVASEPVEIDIDDDAVKGEDDAPVTIIEFSDFECPYCKRYVDGAYAEIKEKYIDTGKVKYVFRDFPLGFHQKAKPAAMAAECVKEDGGDDAYWDYHDMLFANQQAIDIDSLKKYATDLGYDIADCLDSEKFAEEVDADMAAGQEAGVRGTPAFFINGRLISGAQPFSAFETVIEEELNK